MSHREDRLGRDAKDRNDSGLFAVMAMMMACCVGIFIILALIPVLGWPVAIVVAVVGGALLMYVHQRVMRHGSQQ